MGFAGLSPAGFLGWHPQKAPSPAERNPAKRKKFFQTVQIYANLPRAYRNGRFFDLCGIKPQGALYVVSSYLGAQRWRGRLVTVLARVMLLGLYRFKILQGFGSFRQKFAVTYRHLPALHDDSYDKPMHSNGSK